ncbi:MAG: di-trans,poly-cis-decaprenylcistransferase [Chromatiales bacterium]|nr:di-trans,poly-cis-decaprenylcistransferase [Chromatiales bacterium]
MFPDAVKNLHPLPRHVAVIMDGNGRWAQSQGRQRHFGHRAGVRSARALVEAAAEQQIQVLTLFAFSSENWKRPATEVDGLMRLFVEVLQREVDALHENGIQLRFIGARDTLPTILRKRMADAEARTAGNTRMTLVLAVAYGGHWDIVEAVRRVAAKVKSGHIEPGDIDEQLIQRHTALAGLPAPDLLIRTGGEKRISNFLLWDLAYTEFYFTPTLWPEFDTGRFREALEHYRSRQRRFGGVVPVREAVAGD